MCVAARAMAKRSGGGLVHSSYAMNAGVRVMAVGGRTSTGCPGVSGLTAGSGLMGVGLMGVVGRTGCPGRMGCPGRSRTDGGVFGSPGVGNTGATPG
jgi:hypothetical protein